RRMSIQEFSVFECIFFFQAEDGIRDFHVTGVQTCALPIFAQCDAWPSIARGENTLLLASTGSGKTLAAFLVALNRLVFSEQPPRSEERRVGKEGSARAWQDHRVGNDERETSQHRRRP